MLKSIKQIFEILDKPSRLRLALLMFPIAITTTLELFSIALVLPVIQVTVVGEINYGPVLKFIELFPELDFKNVGYWVAPIFGGIFILKNIFLLVTMYIVNLTMDYTAAVYAKKLFQIYLYRPLLFHYNNNSALLLRNLTSGIYSTMGGAKLFIIMIFDGMIMIAAVVMLLIIEPLVTCAGALFLTAIAVSYYLVFSPIFKSWGEVSLTLEGSRNKWMLQSLSGIRDVKVINAHSFLVSKVYSICRQHAKVYSLSATGIHIPRLLIESSVVAGFLVVVLFMSSSGQSKGEIVTIIGLFGMAAFRIGPSLNRFLMSASDLRKQDPYISTTHEAFTTGNEESLLSPDPEEGEEFRFSDHIEIADGSFTYPGSKTPALSQLSVKIKKGEFVGIVGGSGSGKSTLIDIILGLLEPNSGQLLIDGKKISKNTRGWQQKCGFVPQNIFLLDDTIRRNVAFSLEDFNIEDSRVLRALSMSGLDAFVDKLPDGLDTILGEEGGKLSGGQRQRVAIARALYHDPQVLVFDEATSALDNETEKEIASTLKKLGGDKTILIIAHRLSTVQECDKLFFLENGKLLDSGSFNELNKNNEKFRKVMSL